MDTNSCIRLFADPEQIRNCKQKLAQAQDTISKLLPTLSLIGNEVRLNIVYLLEQEKELCPCDLSDILQMTIPAVSQHLKKMKMSNLVQTRKEGQTIFYSLTGEGLALLKPLFRHINQSADKLETA